MYEIHQKVTQIKAEQSCEHCPVFENYRNSLIYVFVFSRKKSTGAILVILNEKFKLSVKWCEISVENQLRFWENLYLILQMTRVKRMVEVGVAHGAVNAQSSEITSQKQKKTIYSSSIRIMSREDKRKKIKAFTVILINKNYILHRLKM